MTKVPSRRYLFILFLLFLFLAISGMIIYQNVICSRLSRQICLLIFIHARLGHVLILTFGQCATSILSSISLIFVCLARIALSTFFFLKIMTTVSLNPLKFRTPIIRNEWSVSTWVLSPDYFCVRLGQVRSPNFLSLLTSWYCRWCVSASHLHKYEISSTS